MNSFNIERCHSLKIHIVIEQLGFGRDFCFFEAQTGSAESTCSTQNYISLVCLGEVIVNSPSCNQIHSHLHIKRKQDDREHEVRFR